MEPPNLQIETVIKNLYAECGLEPPGGQHRITPLGVLLGSFNLTWHEIEGLTGRSAGEMLIQQGGMLVPMAEANTDPLAGFLYVSAHCGSIFVEHRDRITRRRFSAAHELGHYLLHFRPLIEAARASDHPDLIALTDGLGSVDDEVEPGNFSGQESSMATRHGLTALGLKLPPYEQMEQEADAFAAELLMPAGVLAEQVHHQARIFKGQDLVKRLAAELLVSQAAMRWRLRSLGLLTPPAAPLN
jgi:hypothetical protein